MSKCTPEQCEQLYDSVDKWGVSFLSGLIFMIVSSPYMYDLVSKLAQSFNLTITEDGVPTLLGLTVMSAIFTLIVRVLMR